MMKNVAAITAFMLAAQLVTAQDAGRAQKLYKAGFYSRAIHEVEGLKTPDAEAIRTLCKLRLKTDEAYSKAQEFLNAHADNVNAPAVRYLWGMSLFDEQRYGEAVEVLGAVKPGDLSQKQLPEYYYKTGYAAYSSGDWEGARPLLEKSALRKGDFHAPASFTLGYMDYAREHFQDAEKWFGNCLKDNRFATQAQYYILECRFNEGDYRYVAREGEAIYRNMPEDRRPRLSRILSESFLVLGDVEKAREYNGEGFKDTQAPTRSDYFRAGEIAYLSQDWRSAVENFSRMDYIRDSLGQMASYQSAYSQIQLHNKVAAMHSFKTAAEMDYVKDIQEDAFYNYAKLAFDLGNDTAPFADYLKRYSSRNDQIYSYMAMAALQNHDYESAVEAYDHIEELDEHMRSNYMKAYLLRAKELMDAGSWRMAAPLLKAAAYYSPRREGFNQICRYYLAEALYRDGKYEEARKELTDLDNLQALSRGTEGKLIPYHIGYTYFKEADYAKAQEWFGKYLKTGPLTMGADAATRSADCSFFLGDYAAAMDAFKRQVAAYGDAQSLYSRYRAGLSAGLLGKENDKVTILEPALEADGRIPYYGESLYELGRAYVATGASAKAAETFKTLSKTTGDPSLAAQSLLELGMIARNAGRSDEALGYYKQVVAGGSEWADDALLAVESIYRTKGDPDAYLDYVNSLSGGTVRTEAQKEDVYFSSAEQVYLSGDTEKARRVLESYIEKYPEGASRPKAIFYLAHCMRDAGQKDQAIDLYGKARAEGLDGALGEDALRSQATLYHETGQYAKAYDAWKELGEIARMDANKNAALTGRMRAAFKGRMWRSAIADASSVLASSKDAALQREAMYVRAKSLLASSRRDEAMKDLRALSAQPSTAEGAESAYLIIEDLYNNGQLDRIQDAVYDLSGKAGGQNYWLAKAFIVLGDSFAEQGNTVQARATFESIVSGYTPFGPADDVLDQVNLRLQKL